jgi:hypothetical protein
MYVSTKDVAFFNMYKTPKQLATTHVSPNGKQSSRRGERGVMKHLK